MVDSMPHHWVSWIEFTKKRGIDISLEELMNRTSGKNGMECARAVSEQPQMDEAVAISTGHTAAELAGPHVIAFVAIYHELLNLNFLENLHVAA